MTASNAASVTGFAAASQATASAPSLPSSLPAKANPEVGTPAGFITRLIAISVDFAAIVVAILAAGLMTEIVSLLFPRWPGLTDALRVAVGAVISIVPAAYFIIGTALTGRTIGKGLMGIRIVQTDGRRPSIVRSVGRTLAYLVSLIPAGAGFWAVLLDRDRRGWHDHLAGTRVIHDRPRPGT